MSLPSWNETPTKQVILDLKGESCAHALAHMVDHLVSRGILDSSLRDEVLSLLEQREAQVSTGIGSGVAIPHAFSDSIDHVIAAFGRSSEGVDFEAIDNAPVNLVMLLIVPEAQHNMHLQTLAAIAKMFHNCSHGLHGAFIVCKINVFVNPGHDLLTAGHFRKV